MMTQGQSLTFLATVFLIGISMHFLSYNKAIDNISLDKSVDQEILYQFTQFQQKFGKKYETQEEEAYRFQIFFENLLFIEENQGDTWSLAINEFADLTKNEFTSLYLGFKKTQLNKNQKLVREVEPLTPGAINWVTNLVTPTVQNQGSCGSCWAFSASEAIDSAYGVYKKYNPVPLVSVQQLVSCSSAYGNEGCNGGWMSSAFDYVISNPLNSASAYKYTGRDSTCNSNLAKNGTYGISSYMNVTENNCLALENALNIQPVSVAVDASNWQFYSSGILSKCSTELNHGVLAVGYNITSDLSTSYWLVQNSWGVFWGQNGFIKLAITPQPSQKNPEQGTCGICMVASYPLL